MILKISNLKKGNVEIKSEKTIQTSQGSNIEWKQVKDTAQGLLQNGNKF